MTIAIACPEHCRQCHSCAVHSNKTMPPCGVSPNRLGIKHVNMGSLLVADRGPTSFAGTSPVYIQGAQGRPCPVVRPVDLVAPSPYADQRRHGGDLSTGMENVRHQALEVAMAGTGGSRRRRTSTFGNVRKLPSGRYQASYWHQGKRYTGPKTYDTKADADAWLATQRTAVLQGGWVDPEAGRERFGSFATTWLDHRPDLRPRSETVYRSLLKVHLLPTFGSTPIGKITPSMVSAWYVDLVARAPGTAPASYRLLRAIMNSAVRDEKLVRSPCRVTGGGVDRAPERKMLTTEQVQQLTEAMPHTSRVAVTLAAWGGLRRGEVLGL